MIKIRRSEERGHADHGWLDTYHSFSFGDYYDPEQMGFGALRVINEDKVAGGGGFPKHPHRDMEIFTYVISGALQHQDSMGNSEVIRPGEVQRMTAGTGVYHSEFNHSPAEAVHLLQIWIVPERKGLQPGYAQKRFEPQLNQLQLALSRDGREGSLTLNQDVNVYIGHVEKGKAVEHRIGPGRKVWVQLISGGLKTDAGTLGAGDGLAVSGESGLKVEATTDAHFLLFDLADQ
ncbi:MAG: pirin family protein [Verrucomicrobiota bacterium]|nr:pirin family protein [Verrucomicrobiota bacterium]